MKARIFASAAFAMLASCYAMGQVGVSSASGDIVGDAGMISYSVGDIFVIPIVSESGSITSSLLQPIAISTVSGVDDKRISLDVSVSPNPTTDRLTLRVEDMNYASLSYSLVNRAGVPLKQGKLTGNVMDIDVSVLGADIYLLNVAEDGRQVKTFKIVKK